MKKLLVGSAAIALGLVVAAPAHAQLQLGVAGHFKGYISWEDQDTNGTGDERHVDILRDTEVHFTGETTLDNGLTVGVHVEAEADAGDDFNVDESYAYMSGFWGRVNVGDEDGAAYLLQVAAPSADSNVDGIRQYINPVNYAITDLAGLTPATTTSAALVGLGAAAFTQTGEGLNVDYANDATRHSDKLTYLTPVFGGFQGAASYTPHVDGVNQGNLGTNSSSSLGNDSQDDDLFGSAYEGALRWEGTYNNIGINLGGGYTWVESEAGGVGLDDFKEWNVGADLNFAAFGLGGIYSRNNEGLDGSNDSDTWVVGADYTTGPFKLGASYYRNEFEGAAGVAGVGTPATVGDVDTDRYSGGVVYTFAPGMSFRGSVGVVRTDVEGGGDVDATYGLLGTQINF